MLSRAAILPGLMLSILLVLLMAPNGSSSSRLRGTTCFRRVTQLVTYLQPIRYTQLVRTRKCHFLIFCKTAYRTRETYRMERRTKTAYKMKVECCEGHYEVDGFCIPDPSYNSRYVTTPRGSSFHSTSDILPSSYERPTSTAAQNRTISDDSNQGAGVGGQTSTWIFRNTTEPILVGKNKELHITDGNQTTLIIAFVGCILSVFTIIVVIVIYRRRKKASKYMGEIPYTPDVLPLPSKSKKDGPAPQEGLNYRNFPPTDENFYMSMDSGSNLQVPSVKMMLATRGSGYRFSGLEEDPRRRADTLYVTPDQATYNNENRKTNVAGADTKDRSFPNKTQLDKSSSDIYMNGQDIKSSDEDDDENIYSEIKAKNFKVMETSADEHGYSCIRMECVKETTPEETDREAETALYSSLHECDSSNDGIKSVSNSKQSNETKGDKYDSLTKAKRRSNCGRQGEINETETRDDACDSGIYTSINIDSDKDDEINSDTTYDQPKKKTQMDETKRNESQPNGTDFYENCRRNSDESNYDIPRTQKKDEEEAIYSDISSPTVTNTSVAARTS